MAEVVRGNLSPSGATAETAQLEVKDNE